MPLFGCAVEALRPCRQLPSPEMHAFRSAPLRVTRSAATRVKGERRDVKGPRATASDKTPEHGFNNTSTRTLAITGERAGLMMTAALIANPNPEVGSSSLPPLPTHLVLFQRVVTAAWRLSGGRLRFDDAKMTCSSNFAAELDGCENRRRLVASEEPSSTLLRRSAGGV
jgi:hypothetical protein